MKKCTKCGSLKSLDEFYKKAEGRQGVSASCKECIRSSRNKRYAEDSEYRNRILERQRADANPARAKINNARSRERYRNSPDRREQVSEWGKKYNSRPEVKLKKRDYNLRKCFGIGLVDFEKMEDEQDHVCAICGNKETTERNGVQLPLHVDHNHRTGKIRGLLCNRCNRTVGLFEDNIDIMASAISYLQQ